MDRDWSRSLSLYSYQTNLKDCESDPSTLKYLVYYQSEVTLLHWLDCHGSARASTTGRCSSLIV